MFSFLTVARGLRAIKAAMLAKNYVETITLVATLLDSADLKGVGDTVRGTLAGITEGNARDTAVGVLGFLAKLLGGVFGFDSPITVGAGVGTKPGAEDDQVCDSLESLAASCEKAGSATVGAAAGEAESIPPVLVEAMITLAFKLVTEFMARRRAR